MFLLHTDRRLISGAASHSCELHRPLILVIPDCTIVDHCREATVCRSSFTL